MVPRRGYFIRSRKSYIYNEIDIERRASMDIESSVIVGRIVDQTDIVICNDFIVS